MRLFGVEALSEGDQEAMESGQVQGAEDLFEGGAGESFRLEAGAGGGVADDGDDVAFGSRYPQGAARGDARPTFARRTSKTQRCARAGDD